MKSGILVVIEQREGAVKRSSLEALAAARSLKSDVGGEVNAVIIGNDLGTAIAGLADCGADKLFTVQSPLLANYSPEGWCRSAVQAAEVCDCGIVFVAATTLGRDLAPALACALEAGYAAEATALAWRDGNLHVTRPVYAGKALATVTCRRERLVVGLRPNVFPVSGADAACTVQALEPTIGEDGIRARVTQVSAATKGKKDVAEADIVVTGGRGVGSPEGFAPLEALAEVLDAAVGASRAVVDLGWRPHAEQVGQTGKVVSPKLYIACGVSGAIQHLAGMTTSKVIVAINKDAGAPIFKVADYGIEGDLFEVVPALTEALKTSLA